MGVHVILVETGDMDWWVSVRGLRHVRYSHHHCCHLISFQGYKDLQMHKFVPNLPQQNSLFRNRVNTYKLGLFQGQSQKHQLDW